jgi:hypothetical protein
MEADADIVKHCENDGVEFAVIFDNVIFNTQV